MLKSLEKTKANKLTLALLTIYMMVLIWIILFKLGVHFSYMEIRNVNLIPFSECFSANNKIDVSEIILNVAIFVPLGLYTEVLLHRRSYALKFFIFFMVSFMFEGLQYIFRIGAFDSTDILTNAFGGILGLLFVFVLEKLLNNSVQAQKIINIGAAAGTLVVVSFLLLLKLNMLPLRYQ